MLNRVSRVTISSSVHNTTGAAGANSVFAVVVFTGQGAELLRQELADAASDLRHAVQAAVEFDVAQIVAHLGVSVHGVRAIAGAPARQLVLDQRLDCGTSSSGGGGGGGGMASSSTTEAIGLGMASLRLSSTALRHSNTLAHSNGVYCCLQIRTNSAQQCAAVGVSLRGSLLNNYNFRTLHKLISRVVCAKPSRVVGDFKARTQFEGALFTSLIHMQEVAQRPGAQPQWFVAMFSKATHIFDPASLERYIENGGGGVFENGFGSGFDDNNNTTAAVAAGSPRRAPSLSARSAQLSSGHGRPVTYVRYSVDRDADANEAHLHLPYSVERFRKQRAAVASSAGTHTDSYYEPLPAPQIVGHTVIASEVDARFVPYSSIRQQPQSQSQQQQQPQSQQFYARDDEQQFRSRASYREMPNDPIVLSRTRI